MFRANELCTKIDNEIAIVHKFVQDMYSERFPELSGMIPEASVFLKTVNILANDIDKGLKKLDEVLTPQTILIVSVTASTTSGKVCTFGDIRFYMTILKVFFVLTDFSGGFFIDTPAKLFSGSF